MARTPTRTHYHQSSHRIPPPQSHSHPTKAGGGLKSTPHRTPHTTHPCPVRQDSPPRYRRGRQVTCNYQEDPTSSQWYLHVHQAPPPHTHHLLSGGPYQAISPGSWVQMTLGAPPNTSFETTTNTPDHPPTPPTQHPDPPGTNQQHHRHDTMAGPTEATTPSNNDHMAQTPAQSFYSDPRGAYRHYTDEAWETDHTNMMQTRKHKADDPDPDMPDGLAPQPTHPGPQTDNKKARRSRATNSHEQTHTAPTLVHTSSHTNAGREDECKPPTLPGQDRATELDEARNQLQHLIDHQDSMGTQEQIQQCELVAALLELGVRHMDQVQAVTDWQAWGAGEQAATQAHHLVTQLTQTLRSTSPPTTAQLTPQLQAITHMIITAIRAHTMVIRAPQWSQPPAAQQHSQNEASQHTRRT